MITLHDRRVPRSSANIDHIAVSPSGIYVIDAKYRETGRVERRTSGSIFRPGPPQLWVGKRNCTPLVGKMAGQLSVVMDALEGCAAAVNVPVRPMLAFVNAEWGLFASAIDIAGVLVVWPKEMAKIVVRPGPTTPDAVAAIAHHLASRLRTA
ncbi:MAG: nuclease-related domain-containing protein [Acidimicrobiales bacterium]